MDEDYSSDEGQAIAPSLVDLCINTAIDNLRRLGDVGETDSHLLKRILPHCTVDQLMHVEKSTKGRDLTPITDKLWKKFYEKEFGTKRVNEVIERMKQKKVAFRWIQLYEAKLKEVDMAENLMADKLKSRYQEQMLENKVGKFKFAQRFHHQAIKEAGAMGLATMLLERAT